MPTPKKKSKPKRKQGAQPNNKNALKHGFYADKFTDAESKRLDSQGETDLKAEIALLRVCLDRLLQELDFDPKTITDANGNNLRDMHYIHQLNTLTAMTQSVGTLARTEYLIRGKNEGIQKSLLEALELVRLDLGI
jgi:hypothetical protein